MSSQWGPTYGQRKTAPQTPTDLGSAWPEAAQKSKTGLPLANLYNALLALRNDPAMRGRLRYDEMAAAVATEHGPLTDVDVFRVHEWMQALGLHHMRLETVREAVDSVAREHPFHPLRRFLEALAWDGESRLANWLTRYLGTPDDSYHASIGFWFLLSLVARPMRPGCKADYMLVLEGPQGCFKSSAVAILAGEYFSDTLPDLNADPVRTSLHLRGKWIIEIPELSSFSRADQSRLKAFITTQVEQYTPKYAHNPVHEPRQCVFVGTTNKQTYLLDDTGARRFWPVTCGHINLDALARDRNQLLAEAMHHFRNGLPWWPDPDFEEKVLKPMQASRYEADAWDEPILAFILPRTRTTLLEIAENVLGFQKYQFNRAQQLRIAAILRRAGWKSRRSTGGQYVWEPVQHA